MNSTGSAHKLVQSHHVQTHVHGTGLIGRFNAWFAVAATQAVGTMWAFYLFCLIALVSFPAALTAFLHGDTVTGIAWLSQSAIQLVLLPLLLVGQRVISAAQDARAQTDHDTLVALHALTTQNEKLLELQSQVLEQQTKTLVAIEKGNTALLQKRRTG